MKVKCSVIGCDRNSHGRGLCGQHYQAARNAGQLPAEWSRGKTSLYLTNEQRLLDKIVKDPITGCWNWSASVGPDGYGQTAYKDERGVHRAIRAHRLAWKVWRGEILNEKFVCHKCDNKRCVNPNHLYLGTHQDNMQDIIDRNRRKNINSGENNGRAKLAQGEAEEIRDLYYKRNITQESIANMYGISQFAVSMIVRYKRYNTG